MKILNLKTEVITHEKRFIEVDDPDADLEYEDSLVAEYTIKLKKPKIRYDAELLFESIKLLPGGIYMSPSGLKILADSSTHARTLETKPTYNKTFSVSENENEFVLIFSTFKEQ